MRKRDKQLLLRYTSEEKQLIEDILKDTGLNKNDAILKIIKDYKEKQENEEPEVKIRFFLLQQVERLFIKFKNTTSYLSTQGL